MNRPLTVLATALVLTACGKEAGSTAPAPTRAVREEQPFPLDPQNIVNIAAGSKDHTTLVAALQAADYVKSVANPGPLTVFAPTNAACAALPPGTVDDLLRPDNKADLQELIKYHATTTAYDPGMLGRMHELGMANGKKVRIRQVDGELRINDARVVASIRGSNGYVHVVDAVLTPPPK